MNKNICITIYKNPYLTDKYYQSNPVLSKSPATTVVLPKKQKWNEICTIIKKSLLRGKDIICKGVINKLTKKYINTMDFIFIMMNKRVPQDDDSWYMNSFSLCKHQENGYNSGIYIVLLCALSLGSLLLKAIEIFAKKTTIIFKNISYKYSYIELYALSYVINFYRKYGYRHIFQCKEKNIESNEIRKLSQKYKNIYFENDSKIFEYVKDLKNNTVIIKKNHPEFYKLLEYLIQNGFCEQLPKTSNKLDDYLIYNSFCLETGILMKKCFKNKSLKKKIEQKIKYSKKNKF